MVRKFTISIILLACINLCWAQASYVDSVKQELGKTQNDTAKISLLSILSVYYQIKPDSSLKYSTYLLEKARKLHYPLIEAFADSRIAYSLVDLGQYPKSLETIQQGLKLAEDPASEKNILPDKYSSSEEYHEFPLTPRLHRLNALADLLQVQGILYSTMRDPLKEMKLDSQALGLINQTGNLLLKCRSQIILGIAYSRLGAQDSALRELDSAYDLATKLNFKRYVGSILLNYARIYKSMHDYEKASAYYREAMKAGREEYPRGVAAASIENGGLFSLPANKDSALWYEYAGLETAMRMEAPELIMRAYDSLGKIYRLIGNNDSAVKYMGLVINLKNRLFNAGQGQQFQNIEFAQQQKEEELLSAQKSYKNRLILYGVVTWAVIFLVIASILWRNNRNKQRDYALLQAQKQETDNQKNKAEDTLKELRATQAQLIQSEKMASLGEMSAGIAHEIQNPLNFVNNFSEVNKELLTELKTEAVAGNNSEVITIANNIESNESKINYHGKRADAIVKGMLQHSRSSTGQNEATDINALADEHLRLSYYGIRAKDKDFNATLNTDFDQRIGKVSIIPQDIGRLLLNLYNNAFYAVSQKKKQNPDGYQPAISVTTKKLLDKIEIRVMDNGNGIPHKIVDKIFQPFFTTKPTGQGTGLGLSLSYDIVKTHGGELKVETKEGEYAEFYILLPA
jgi:signal transduction histidine kinase